MMGDTHDDTTVGQGQERPKMTRDWYTTSEAAHELGLSASAMRDAVRRGAIRVERIHGRLNGIRPDELARYREEHQGGNGWDKRRDPAYQPSKGAQYARAYRERRRAAQQQEQSAEE